MNIGIFGDQKFLYDSKGNYYTKGNLRRVLLEEYAKHFKKIYMFFRTIPSDLSWAPQEDIIKNDKVEFINLPTFKGMIGFPWHKNHIAKVLENNIHKCDICVLRFCYNISCLAAPIIKKHSLPSIAHLRGDIYKALMLDVERIPSKPLRWLIASYGKQKNVKAVNLCDRIIGTSKAVANLYAEHGRWTDGIADGCTTKDFFLPARVRRKDEPVNIILVARINYAKNIQQVIKACAILKKREAYFKLYIIGDGPYLSKLKKLSYALGVSDLVVFQGRINSREELIKHYKRSHIGVLTSRTEGLPSSVLESMAASLPVVCTDLPCIREILSEGVNGFIVPIDDIEMCADRLFQLIKNETLRRQMGEHAQAKAIQFRTDNQVKKLWHLCYELLSSPVVEKRK